MKKRLFLIGKSHISFLERLSPLSRQVHSLADRDVCVHSSFLLRREKCRLIRYGIPGKASGYASRVDQTWLHLHHIPFLSPLETAGRNYCVLFHYITNSPSFIWNNELYGIISFVFILSLRNFISSIFAA